MARTTKDRSADHDGIRREANEHDKEGAASPHKANRDVGQNPNENRDVVTGDCNDVRGARAAKLVLHVGGQAAVITQQNARQQ